MDVPEDFYSLIEDMFSWDSMEDFLSNISRQINAKLGAERSTLFIYDSIDNSLKSVVFMAKVGEKITIPLTVPSIAGASFKSRKPFLVEDVADQDYLNSIGVQYHECWKIIPDVSPTKNMLSVPIILKEEPLGVFVAVNKFPKFNQEDVEYIKNISRVVAVAIKNLEKQLQLHYINLLNRKVIDTVSAGIIVTDRNLNITHVNDAFLQMTGYRYGQNDVIGKGIYDTFPFLEKFKDKVDEAVANDMSQEFVTGILRVKVVPLFSNYLFEPRLSNIIFVIES